MDIKFIRSNPDLVRANQIKRFKDPSIVDKILELDNKFITNDYQISKHYQLKKIVSKMIKNKKSSLTIADMERKSESQNENTFNNAYNLLLKNKLEEINKLFDDYSRNDIIPFSRYIDTCINTLNLDQSLKERDKLINQLGNFLGDNVPISDNEDYNQIVCGCNNLPPTVTNKLGHFEITQKLNILDMETGSRISGNRGYFLKGLGVKLNMALMMYAIEFLEDRCYTPITTPHFMNQDVMGKLCQMEDYDDTLYKVNSSNNDPNYKYMIATSEQPLTGYYENKILNSEDLPIKFAGLSTCYRKEAGKNGVDTNGIFRVHQFEKVEQLCLTDPDKSWAMFEEMIATSREFYDSLGITYRVVTIVSGALNNSASKKYDLEGYFAGSESYKELVSCSNCTDFFSKRLNIKNNHDQYVHILNSTLCANTRTLCCILEQYQTDQGVKVPEVLRKYMNGVDFLPYFFVTN